MSHDFKRRAPYQDIMNTCMVDCHKDLDCKSDVALARLYRMHRALWNVRFEDATPLQESKGSASTEATLVFSRFLGILAHSVGHHYRYMCDISRCVIRCYQAAATVFAYVEPSSPGPLLICYLDVIETILDCEITLGLLQEARNHLESLIRPLHYVYEMYERAASVMPFRAAACKRVVWLTTSRCLQRLLQMCSNQGDLVVKMRTTTHSLAEKLCQSSTTSEERLHATRQMAFFDFLEADHKLMVCMEAGSREPPRELLHTFHPDLEDHEFAIEASLRLIETCIKLDLTDEARKHANGALTLLLAKCLQSVGADARVEIESFLEIDYAPSPLSPAWTAMRECAQHCLEISVRAKLWVSATDWARRLELISPGFFTNIHCWTRIWRWQRLLWLGLIRENCGDHKSALNLYGESFGISSDVPVNNNLEESRSRGQTADTGRITNAITRAYLKLAECEAEVLTPASLIAARTNVYGPASNAIGYALSFIESGKAPFVTKMLALGDSNTKVEEQEQWQQKDRDYKIWRELRALGSGRSAVEGKEFRELNSRWLELDSYLSRRPGPVLSAFSSLDALNLNLVTMINSLPEATLVVYTSLSEDCLVLYCFNNTTIVHASVNSDVSQVHISRKVFEYVGFMNKQKAEADTKRLKEISRDLSRIVIEPIQGSVSRSLHVIFVPSGELSRFPLGALLLGDSCIALTRHVSQVPSLYFWYHHHQLPLEVKVSVGGVTAIARPGNWKEELQPCGEARLPMGGIEALMIAAFWGTRPLNAIEVGREDFRGALQQSRVLHVCTHGYFKRGRSQHSYMSMKENLRVIDLTGVVSRANVVIFSTCLSGSGWSFASDDVAGFAHAILATGATVFAGCFWKANDLTTLLHMVLFYGGF